MALFAIVSELKDRMLVWIDLGRAVLVEPDDVHWLEADGRAISVNSPSRENHRRNIRATDLDGDGFVDEDPPDDLDRDGRILRMRVLDPEGQWKISPDDDRLMLRREDQNSVSRQAVRRGPDADHAQLDVFVVESLLEAFSDALVDGL